jgi:alpha-L-rhamnosidase
MTRSHNSRQRNRLLCGAAVALSLLLIHQSLAADLAWPQTTNETKPWSRWWWLGSIVTEDGLRSEMKKYADAGLGGLEITPIYGVRGEEDQFIQYLSPKWVDRFEFVLGEAKRLGMQIDMNHGTGWPMGGPWVTPDDTCKYLAHQTITVKPGEQVKEPIVMNDAGMVAFVGKKRVPITQLVEPFGSNPDLQEMAIDQLRMPGSLKLVALMAYPEKGAALNLTEKISAEGKLDWTAPTDAGSWTLYAMFQGLHSRMVKRAAPGDEGHVPDHFSAEAMGHYFAKFDEVLKGRDLSGFRAFFNDSYEVDDGTRGEANFTPKFFEEFQRRRGYDLREHLPALFATQPSDENSRLLCDYRETISDLLLDNFTGEWHKWAAQHGKVIRNQSHGSPANVLDLYAAVDIPETEGFGGSQDELRERVSMMYASSAAHVTGKRLASSETCTWLDDHFLTTLAHAKQRVDQTLLAGINHIFYHGTTYSPPDEAWPGFLFYAAVEFDTANSSWDDFPALNKYIERCQSFLQAGRPDNDVLLYAPFHDDWMARGNGTMPHYKINGRFPAQDIGEQLLKAGYTFDFVSDRLLKDVTFTNGKLHAGGNTYRAIVLPETKFIPLATMEKLLALVKDGAVLVVNKSLPADVPGWNDLDERRAKLKNLVDAMRKNGVSNVSEGETTTVYGAGGRVVEGADVPRMLSRAGVRGESLAESKIQFIRRRLDGKSVYFLVNQSTTPIDDWVTFATAKSTSAGLFDPLTGRKGRAAMKAANDNGSQVYLQLAPGESCIVEFSEQSIGGPSWSYHHAAVDPQPLHGEWSVTFVKGGPALPADLTTDTLRSWTEFGGDAAKAFSGTAKYTLKFAKPQAVGKVWRLDLGRVAESCRVSLNGKELGTLIAPPFSIDVPADELHDENTLEVSVSNLMANRIADMDRHNVLWKRFYNANVAARDPVNRGAGNVFSAANWTPHESGLIGPVTLTALETFDPLVTK